tara:strand:- start:5053 stop:7020 length:1968 start_codon:yes stop_codon:yes gene_type:complete
MPVFMSGKKVEKSKSQPPIMGDKPNEEWVKFWHDLVVGTLRERRRKYDPKWRDMKLLVENSESGMRKGNLASDFIKTLHARLLRKDIVVNVNADDPDYMLQGENAEIVANSIARVAGLQEALRRLITDGTWASFGCLEVGHPIDPASQSIMHVFRTPNVQKAERAVDVWKEVSFVPNEFANEVPNMPNNVPNPETEVEPEPIFSPGVGYPWVQSVDPRLIIMPLSCREAQSAPWVARLRFLTRGELVTVLGWDPGDDASSSGEWSDIFDETAEDAAWNTYPELTCIVELYIRRDRNSPSYNNYFLSFVLGRPEKVIAHGVNPWGGMVPLIPIKLDPLKPMYGTTLAEEISPFADGYHRGVDAVMRQLLDLLNEKHLISTGAGLSDEEEKKLYNPFYRGPIHVNDPNGIKRLGEQRLDPDLLRTLTFIKSIAQTRSGQSDMDRGTAIKEITARQTQALLDATGISVEAMGTMVSLGAREAVMKLMHLTGLFSTVGRGRKFYFGNRFADMNQGTHDFVNSMIYVVTVEDNAEQFTTEDRMMWVQFLRTLFADTGGFLAPFFDGEGLARETIKVFSRSPVLLSSRSPNREPQGRNPGQDQQVEAMLSGMGQESSGPPGSQMIDMIQGQHPERDVGSRGVNVGNAVRGQLAVGTGTGEY